MHVISADAYTVDGARRLAEQGVTDGIVGFRWPYRTGPETEPLADKITKLRRFADAVIARMPAGDQAGRLGWAAGKAARRPDRWRC